MLLRLKLAFPLGFQEGCCLRREPSTSCKLESVFLVLFAYFTFFHPLLQKPTYNYTTFEGEEEGEEGALDSAP